MPEQKLIFLDIDGTLLPPGEMVAPDSAIAAVRRAQGGGAQGVSVHRPQLPHDSPLAGPWL